MTLVDNITMFASNIRAVNLKKLNLLWVLFPCQDANKNRDTGIVPALETTLIQPLCAQWDILYTTKRTVDFTVQYITYSFTPVSLICPLFIHPSIKDRGKRSMGDERVSLSVSVLIPLSSVKERESTYEVEEESETGQNGNTHTV